MKLALCALLALITLNSYAEEIIYNGVERNGEECFLRIDHAAKDMGMDTCHFRDSSRSFKIKGNQLIGKGSVEFFSCKVKVTLDEKGEPKEATLSTLSVVKPFFTRKQTCRNLVREN